MKKLTLIYAFLFFYLSTYSQIDKGFWMLGGDASFAYGKNKSNSIVNGESFNLEISPNVGYFVVDKLALGASLDYYRSRYKTDDLTSSFDNFWVSPFVRYYFLENEKPMNVFLESSYKFSILKENKATAFSVKTGVAVFLNQSTALEISLQYLNTNSDNIFVGSNAVLLGFGFQLHLERDKNFKF
mgnify:CR=1 FL=1